MTPRHAAICSALTWTLSNGLFWWAFGSHSRSSSVSASIESQLSRESAIIDLMCWRTPAISAGSDTGQRMWKNEMKSAIGAPSTYIGLLSSGGASAAAKGDSIFGKKWKKVDVEALVPVMGDDEVAEAHQHVAIAAEPERVALVEGEGELAGIASLGMPVTCWMTAMKLSSSRTLPSPLMS